MTKKDSQGYTPLMSAVINNKIRAIETVYNDRFRLGIDFNQTNAQGETLLIQAIKLAALML